MPHEIEGDLKSFVRTLCEYNRDFITPQWLAGFFDGEGCVSVQRAVRTGMFGLTVSISQKDKKLINLLNSIFPGSLFTSEYGAAGITWTGHSARPFLEYIKDYTFLKKPQVRLALMFLDYVLPKDVKGHEVSLQARTMRECLGLLILEANQDKKARYDEEILEKGEVQ